MDCRGGRDHRYGDCLTELPRPRHAHPSRRNHATTRPIVLPASPDRPRRLGRPARRPDGARQRGRRRVQGRLLAPRIRERTGVRHPQGTRVRRPDRRAGPDRLLCRAGHRRPTGEGRDDGVLRRHRARRRGRQHREPVQPGRRPSDRRGRHDRLRRGELHRPLVVGVRRRGQGRARPQGRDRRPGPDGRDGRRHLRRRRRSGAARASA